ncbi:hypothetical protein Tco_1532693 [Tanacetum coccineum]
MTCACPRLHYGKVACKSQHEAQRVGSPVGGLKIEYFVSKHGISAGIVSSRTLGFSQLDPNSEKMERSLVYDIIYHPKGFMVPAGRLYGSCWSAYGFFCLPCSILFVIAASIIGPQTPLDLGRCDAYGLWDLKFLIDSMAPQTRNTGSLDAITHQFLSAQVTQQMNAILETLTVRLQAMVDAAMGNNNRTLEAN